MKPDRWDVLGKKIDPLWGPERDHAVRVHIERRVLRRRMATRLGGALVLVALVAGAVGAFVGRRAPPSGGASLPRATDTAPVAVASVTVTPLSPACVVESIPNREGRGFILRTGGARFSAPHDADHPLVVVVRDLVIEDLGTTFTVAFVSGSHVEVAVESGRVRVRAPDAVTEMSEGERREFALEPPPAPIEAVRRTQNSAPQTSWRPLAESGRYDEAHAALKKAGPNAVHDETSDLLLAADAARLSGHPADAVPYLARVVDGHATDPRSGLAAFTLGRVLLDELGRPRNAADAFARARAAGGPLAEDALARLVEATSRAGDLPKSRDLAREYLALYPKGRRAKAVSRFGGLD